MLDLYLRLMAFLKREEGQDLVEYALLLGLIALVVVAALVLAGPAINTIWNNIVTQLQAATT